MWIYRLTALWNRLFGNDIFISYSAHDRAAAEAIEKLLRLGRYRVFRDDSALNTGEHLGRLLAEVRRSTMLMLLVSEHSMASDWVHREFAAYLERPRTFWQLAPVFLDPRYPRNVPERFRELGDFHGVRLPTTAAVPQALETDRALLADLTSHFHAVRTTTLRRWAAVALVVAVASAIGGLVRMNRRDSMRAEMLKRAGIAQAGLRFDEAEADLARAWQLDPQPATLAAYREARLHRALERPSRLAVGRDESVVAVDEAGGEPYIVVHKDDGDAALVVLRNGHRTTLASPCTSAPLLATSGPLIVWTCGRRLGAALANAPAPSSVVLPAEPAGLFLADGRVTLLFREGAAAKIGVFSVPTIQPLSLHLLKQAPAGGEMNFCPEAASVWSFSAESGKSVFRFWNPDGTWAHSEPFSVPDPAGRGELVASWISRVIPARDCGRFFVEYAPFTLAARSTFEMLRIRPDSPRPLDRFDTSVEQLVPAPDESGIEAIYRTGSKELRAFLLTSPVVLDTRVSTLASDVERVARWPCCAAKDLWTIALDRQFVSIYRNRQRWSLYPLAVGEPMRAVSSPDGNWVAVEGEEATLFWKRALPWNGAAPPSPESIEAETVIPQLP